MWLNALMMDAESTYETSVNFFQTIQRNNPDDSHLHVFVSVLVIMDVCVCRYYNCHDFK
jgi:hypothetical protein